MFPRRISSTATSAGRQNMICLELGYSCFGKSVFAVVPITLRRATRTAGPAQVLSLHMYTAAAWDGLTWMGPRFEPSLTSLAHRVPFGEVCPPEKCFRGRESGPRFIDASSQQSIRRGFVRYTPPKRQWLQAGLGLAAPVFPAAQIGMTPATRIQIYGPYVRTQYVPWS